MGELLEKTTNILGEQCSNDPALLDEPIPLRSGTATIRELWRRFDESPYGIYMDNQPLRFAALFGYDRNMMLQDLGADVNPRLHQLQTALYVAWALEYQQAQTGVSSMSRRSAAITGFAASIHDMGETMHPTVQQAVGAVVGDIPFGYKTPADRKVEKAVRKWLFRELYDDVEPEVVSDVESITAHEVHDDRHALFEASHELQTFMTAVHAKIAHARYTRGKTVEIMPEDSGASRLVCLANLHEIVTAVTEPRIDQFADRIAFVGRVRSIAAEAIRSTMTVAA